MLQGEAQNFDKPFYLLGILAACGSMLAWSWYVVSNSQFLKQNPQITSQQWSTVVGVTNNCLGYFLGGLLRVVAWG